jgi:hypothetical protein
VTRFVARGAPGVTFSPEQEASIARQLGVAAPVDAAQSTPKRGAHGGLPGSQGSAMNTTEKRFARYLDELQEGGHVFSWRFTKLGVRLPARRAIYRPDFSVRIGLGIRTAHLGAAHELVLIDVKGRDKETGRPRVVRASGLRMRVAARELEGHVRLWVAWPDGRGGWSWELVEP